MVQLYHQFTRSIRMGNLDLYIHSLYSNSSLFFTFNHHNYARWLVVYHNNFLKLQKTHPQVYEDFRSGCFTIKRTSKQFPLYQLTWRWSKSSMPMLHVTELESVLSQIPFQRGRDGLKVIPLESLQFQRCLKRRT